eukprot:2496292-Alexandrium_andersonii.AAC.1
MPALASAALALGGIFSFARLWASSSAWAAFLPGRMPALALLACVLEAGTPLRGLVGWAVRSRR